MKNKRKRLIIVSVLILVSFILVGCGASYEKEGYHEDTESHDEYLLEPEMIAWDSTVSFEEYEKPLALEISIDVEVKEDEDSTEKVSNKKDSVKITQDTLRRKDQNKRQKLDISPVDTTKVLPGIKKNLKTLDEQQQLLDSLLKEKKK